MNEITVGILSSAIWQMLKVGTFITITRIKEKLNITLSNKDFETIMEKLSKIEKEKLSSVEELTKTLNCEEIESILLKFNKSANASKYIFHDKVDTVFDGCNIDGGVIGAVNGDVIKGDFANGDIVKDNIVKGNLVNGNITYQYDKKKID